MYAHSFMHSRFHLPSHFRDQRDILIIHPSCFQFLFPHCACPVHHLALTETWGFISIIPYSIMCMCVVRSSVLQNCVLFWVFRLLYHLECCCAMVSSVTERVEVCFVVLTLGFDVGEYFSLV